MRLLTFGIIASCLFAAPGAFADQEPGLLNVEESDASPSCFPYKLIVDPDSLTDNGDGTCTYSAAAGLASTFLKLDASNDPLTGTLDTQHILPSASATYDLGFSDDLGTELGYRTLYLHNNNGIVIHTPLADATGAPTSYTQFLGGGGNASEGGTYTMQFYGEQILGGAGNDFVIDFGARPAIGSSISSFKLLSAIGGSVGTIDLTVPINTPLGTAETGFYLNNDSGLLVGYGLVFDNKAPSGDNTEIEFKFAGTNAFSMDLDDGSPSGRIAFAQLQQPAAITNTQATYSLFDIDDTNAMTINGARTSRFQLRVQAPNITISSGSLTNSAALYLDGPATEATNNYTIWDDVGVSRFDGGLDLDTDGVQIREDGDGQLELTGLGNGNDECLALNLDDTANTAVWSNCTSSTGVTTVTWNALHLVPGTDIAQDLGTSTAHWRDAYLRDIIGDADDAFSITAPDSDTTNSITLSAGAWTTTAPATDPGGIILKTSYDSGGVDAAPVSIRSVGGILGAGLAFDESVLAGTKYIDFKLTGTITGLAITALVNNSATYTHQTLADFFRFIDDTSVHVFSADGISSTFELFAVDTILRSATASVRPPAPVIATFRPIVTVDGVSGGTGSSNNVMLDMSPIYRTTGGSASFTIPLARNVFSEVRVRTNTAGSTMDVTTFDHFLASNASLSGAGTETLGTQTAFKTTDLTAATTDIGLEIGGADTYAVWLGSLADNTGAADGITFGLSADTQLYRGAAGNLYTTGDLDINDATPHLRWTPTSGDSFEAYAYASEWYLTNVTDAVVLARWDAANNFRFRGTGVTYGWPTADGTTGQVLTTNGAGGLSWASAAGSGDITGIGDCGGGECFNGSSGTVLTFEGDGGANFTLTYDTTDDDFELSDDLTIEDATPHLRLTDTTGSQDDFEWYAEASEIYLTNVTDAVTLARWDVSNNFRFLSNSVTYAWPTADGSNGQALYTNGTGGLSWRTPFLLSGTNSSSTTSDHYIGVYPSTGGSTSEGVVDHWRNRTALVCRNFYARVENAPGGGNSWVASLRDDGASTALTCTISGTDTSCADTTNVITIAADSALNVFYDGTGPPSSQVGNAWSCECTIGS